MIRLLPAAVAGPVVALLVLFAADAPRPSTVVSVALVLACIGLAIVAVALGLFDSPVTAAPAANAPGLGFPDPPPQPPEPVLADVSEPMQLADVSEPVMATPGTPGVWERYSEDDEPQCPRCGDYELRRRIGPNSEAMCVACGAGWDSAAVDHPVTMRPELRTQRRDPAPTAAPAKTQPLPQLPDFPGLGGDEATRRPDPPGPPSW
jgi:hypothetical protein